MNNVNRKLVPILLMIAMLLIALVAVGWKVGGTKQHPHDCEHVKETCNRKKGCKCKLNCSPEGRRLPPEGGAAECPSYCCEEKCECHAMGCP